MIYDDDTDFRDSDYSIRQIVYYFTFSIQKQNGKTTYICL